MLTLEDQYVSCQRFVNDLIVLQRIVYITRVNTFLEMVFVILLYTCNTNNSEKNIDKSLTAHKFIRKKHSYVIFKMHTKTIVNCIV